MLTISRIIAGGIARNVIYFCVIVIILALMSRVPSQYKAWNEKANNLEHTYAALNDYKEPFKQDAQNYTNNINIQISELQNASSKQVELFANKIENEKKIAESKIVKNSDLVKFVLTGGAIARKLLTDIKRNMWNFHY